MGRKKENKVYRYFNLNEDNTSTCVVTGCHKVLKTQHGANLLKHMKLHKEQYKEIIDLNEDNRCSQTTTTKTLSNSNNVLKECTDLVSVHGRAFALMDDKAFKNIIAMIPNNNCTVNSQNIRKNVVETAARMRMELANELRDKLICLKVDIASISTRSFMGINAQYIQNNRILLKNLGVIELLHRHTAEHLKEMLLFTLRRFRIDTEHIYSITTDNGSNMIKMSKLINIETSADHSEINESTSGVNIRDDSTPHATNSSLNADASDESDSDEFTSSDNPAEIRTEELMEEIRTSLRAELDVGFAHEATVEVGIVRCAAHTLQLAIQDACNDSITNDLIIEARKIIKRLRTPHYSMMLRKNNRNKPKLDCITRWNSTVDMIESLLTFKDICSTDVQLHLSDNTWTALEEMVQSLSPARALSKVLQTEQLTIGDFYLAWMLCQFKLAKIGTPTSCKVETNMKNRQTTLFENNTFINAVFLDPRVNSTLTIAQQDVAKENLINMCIRMFAILRDNQENHEPVRNPSTSSMHSEAERDNDMARNDLEEFLGSCYVEKHDDIYTFLIRNDQRGESYIRALKESLSRFIEEPLLKSTENILQYWKDNKHKYPELYKLACVALAAPATQVSVERLFSSMKFVVTSLRLKLKDDIIEDVLFVRNNTLYEKNKVRS